MFTKLVRRNFCFKKINTEQPFDSIPLSKNYKRPNSPFDEIKISKLREERRHEWKLAFFFAFAYTFYF